MGPNTKVDQAVVNQVSNKHQETKGDVEQILNQTVNNVYSTAQASGSLMTDALETAAEQWRSRVKNKVLSGLEEMANEMNVSAEEQVAADQANAGKVNSLDL